MADSRLRDFNGWHAVCSLSIRTTSATVWPNVRTGEMD
jgi:hypothetical protein